MASEIVFLIPLMGISVGLAAVVGKQIVKPWLAYRERRLELEAKMVAERAAQYAANTGRLEERVRVLERIATDRGVDLSDEIDALRTAPLN